MNPDPRQAPAVRAVRAAVHARNWTPSQLARHAGIDRGTAIGFLNGIRNPHFQTQCRIEAALGWPPGTLTTLNHGTPGHDPGHEPGQDANVLLVQRPVGMSDRDWNRVRRAILQFIQNPRQGTTSTATHAPAGRSVRPRQSRP